jgi:serine/threonine protein phosphatase PrpC
MGLGLLKAKPSIEVYKLEHNDYFSICSDGLSNIYDEKSGQLEKELLKKSQNSDLKLPTQELVDLALKMGSRDNITGLFIQVTDPTTTSSFSKNSPTRNSELSILSETPLFRDFKNNPVMLLYMELLEELESKQV